jgi:hypothetical protein
VIYQFRDSAKAAGYKLAYRYGFQLGDGPDVKKNNLKLYKIFETNEREFMDANCENGDVSPFINQTLMDVYRETVYQGPHAIAWRMIILFRLLPILEKLAPHLLGVLYTPPRVSMDSTKTLRSLCGLLRDSMRSL